MSISFCCPHCGMQMQVDAQLAGQTGPCRQCGRSVTIQYPAGVSSPSPYGCPRCGGGSWRMGFMPWYLGTVGVLIMKPVICNQCGHEYDVRKPHVDLAQRKRKLFWIINGVGAVGIVIVVSLVGWLFYVTLR